MFGSSGSFSVTVMVARLPIAVCVWAAGLSCALPVRNSFHCHNKRGHCIQVPQSASVVALLVLSLVCPSRTAGRLGLKCGCSVFNSFECFHHHNRDGMTSGSVHSLIDSRVGESYPVPVFSAVQYHDEVSRQFVRVLR